MQQVSQPGSCFTCCNMCFSKAATWERTFCQANMHEELAPHFCSPI